MKKLWSIDTPEYHTAMRISEGKHTHPRREEPGLSVQTQKRTHHRTAFTWARGGALGTESADPGAPGRGGIGWLSVSVWRPPHQSAQDARQCVLCPQGPGVLEPLRSQQQAVSGQRVLALG